MNQTYWEITPTTNHLAERLRTFSANELTFLKSGDTLDGNVPGEKIEVKQELLDKTLLLYNAIVRELPLFLAKNPYQRVVLTVCGGSGVGKTSIAALLSCFWKQVGIGCYTLSGDNYPRRIPKYNDAERLRIFRESGIHGMIEENVYTQTNLSQIEKWQKAEEDAEPELCKAAPWFRSYLNGGRKGLEGYLGTCQEIAFEEVNAVISAFKDGAKTIWLRRMGREDTELWYDCVDFTNINLLLIEWTHGNSDYCKGIDFPILLNSTPAETLAYRKSRNRDSGIDKPFTNLVLDIEQELLRKQASKAKLILSKAGELLTYETYCKQMQK